MSRPRVYKTQAIVIRQMPLGEADRIVTFLTPAAGKVRAVARGVRRPKSKLAGHLELLTRVRVSIAEGRTLDHLSEAVALDSHRPIREDLERLAAAMYLAELADVFCVEESPANAAFNLLTQSLERLETAGTAEPLLRHFELRLLSDSGFQPELFSCVGCREELLPGDHLLSCVDGGVFCPNCRAGATESLLPLSLGAMKVLRFLQRESVDKAMLLNVPSATWNDVERVLRTYVRHVAERELRTADFMALVSSGRP